MNSTPYSSMTWIVAAGCFLIATCVTSVVCVSSGLMNPVMAVVLTTMMLLSVSAGFIFCTLEPYRAVHSDEGKQMIASHCTDPSLHCIADIWTDTLFGNSI